MNEDDQKRIALGLIQQLSAKRKDIRLFKAAITKLDSDSSENRIAVAMGLLAIGTDRSETTSYKNFILSQLALFVRACGLRNNKELERRLNAIIDDWIVTLPDQDFHAAPWGALLALGRVNRSMALEKCDYVIKYYDKSEAGRRVRELRKDIESLNPIEK